MAIPKGRRDLSDADRLSHQQPHAREIGKQQKLRKGAALLATKLEEGELPAIGPRRMGEGADGAGGIMQLGEDRDWGNARYEYAFLLRCEGLTYREIGGRLGVTGQRASVMVQKVARILRGAMRRCRWRLVK